MADFTALRGSHVPAQATRSHRLVGDLAAAERSAEAEITLVLREKPAGPGIYDLVDVAASKSLADTNHLTARQLAANHGADDADWRRVTRWAESRGLTVVADHSDKTGRRLHVRGTVSRIDAAFSTRSKKFSWRRPLDGRTFEYRRAVSAPTVPSDIASCVTAVQGLNEAPFSPRLRLLAPHASPRQVYNPEDLAQLYDFPKLPNGGAGMTLNVGIAELGGAVNAKVAQWFFQQKQYANVSMTEFGVNGATPVSDPQGADIEVALDWQVVLRALVECAPNAKINLLVGYGANSDQGFTDLWNSYVTGAGVTSAKTYSAANPGGVTVDPKTIDPTSVVGVSTSWGQNESAWAQSSLQAMDQVAASGALRGVFFANATGDNGAADTRSDGKLDADGPSLCPNVLGIGGTQLNSANGVVTSEPVWDEVATQEGAGGGGVSRYFGVPGYAQAAGISIAAVDDQHTGRVVPDLSLNADPTTGYNVVTDIDAQNNPVLMPVGGTSASTPLATAGFALVSALVGKKLGRVQDTLYTLGQAGTGIRDVTQGNNAYPAGTLGYQAVPGFDAASGWGSADFTALAQAWAATVPTPAPSTPAAPAAPSGPATGLGGLG